MTAHTAAQAGPSGPRSSPPGSQISEEELVDLLSRATEAEPNDPALQSLARLLVSIVQNSIAPEDARNFITITAKMRELLKKLQATDIKTTSKVFSFDGSTTGDVRIGDVAGGNITKISLITPSYEADIFGPINSNELSHFRPPTFAVPQDIARWLQTLEDEQLLVLQGNERYDEDELGRYVALRFAQATPPALGAALPVLQWIRSARARELNAIFAQRQEKAVFVLNGVTISEHGADFFQQLKQGQHFLVVTSAIQFGRWNLTAADRKKWVDLTQGQVYSLASLTAKLAADLRDYSGQAAWHRFLAWTALPSGIAIGKTPLQVIAHKLQTPERCKLFVQLVSKEFKRAGGQSSQRVITPNGIANLLNTLKDDDKILQLWYSSLSTREQYMAIALTCLNDVRDNQFFAALDNVVTRAWRRLEPSLSYTDYQDLNNLCGTYFKPYDTTSDNPVLKSTEEKQRERLFKLLWSYHRRRIVSALPVLTRMARESTRKLASRRNHDLFGDEQRRAKLRQTIGETLSDVGAIAYMPVSDCLLDLATDHNFGCQDMAAEAVARWHPLGAKHQQRVREALCRWLDRDSVETDLEHRNAHSTAALTVAKILDWLKRQGDTSLPSYLEGLLQQLARLPNERSRYYFREKIIPALQRRQLPIAGNFLYALASYEDMHNAIADKLIAFVAEGGEGDVLNLLEGWQQRPQQTTISGTIARLPVMELIVQVGVVLLCSRPVSNLSRFLDLIQAGLQATQAAGVRLRVLYGIRFYLSDDQRLFTQVDGVVRLFLPLATVAERDWLARVLAVLYNEQHQQAGQAQGSLTDELIYTWLGDARSHPAQRAALRSIHYIAKGLTVSAGNATFDPSPSAPARGMFAAIGRGYSDFYRLTLAPLLGTLGQRSLRWVIGGLMPEALIQFRKSSIDFDRVIATMIQANYRNSRAIGRALNLTMAYIEVQRYVTALLILLVLLIGAGVSLALRYL